MTTPQSMLSKQSQMLFKV